MSWRIESGVGNMMKKGKLNKRFKMVIQAIPLAGVIGASLLTVQRSGQQFLVLITLIWIQVFFIVECFLAGK
jgi:hypothetical protein